MKRISVITLISVLLIAALPAAVAAQDTQEEGNFVAELAQSLEETGWSEAEIKELVSAAQELNWEAAEGANSEAVALALNVAERRGGDEDEESELSGLEQAQLALETAVATREMEQAGFEERDVVRAALNGARNTIAQIQSWREGGREGNLGKMIRNQVSEAVRNQARTAERAAARERARKAGSPSETSFSTSVGEVPGGPGGPDF